MVELLPPRDFSHRAVPRRPDGSPLLRCQSEEEVQFYLYWVSDYLYKTDLPLTSDQVDWLIRLQPSPRVVIGDCSDIFAHSLLELVMLNRAFARGQTYAEYRARSLEIYQEEFSDFDREVEGSFEKWVLSEATFERLRRERQQELLFGFDVPFPDVPFRPLLAWALHQVPDPVERYWLMDLYVRTFDQNS